MTFLVLFHEFGHVFTGWLFHWKITKVKILPFGGISFFEHPLNVPLKQEGMVAISGLIFQNIGYLLLPEKDLIFQIHIGLCIFNFLPMIPLDGSKILAVFFQLFFSFKKSYYFLFFVSIFLFLWFLFFSSFSLFFLCTFSLLLFESFRFFKKIPYYFHRFLLERYLYDFSFSKLKTIKNVSQMKRGYEHLLLISGKKIREKVFLEKIFVKK